MPTHELSWRSQVAAARMSSWMRGSNLQRLGQTIHLRRARRKNEKAVRRRARRAKARARSANVGRRKVDLIVMTRERRRNADAVVVNEIAIAAATRIACTRIAGAITTSRSRFRVNTIIRHNT